MRFVVDVIAHYRMRRAVSTYRGHRIKREGVFLVVLCDFDMVHGIIGQMQRGVARSERYLIPDGQRPLGHERRPVNGMHDFVLPGIACGQH